MVLAQNGGLGGGGGDHLREQATATIDAGIQLAKEAALRKDRELMLARSSSLSSQGGGASDDYLRQQATATIDAGIQLAKEAALRKEMVLAQSGSEGGGASDEYLRVQATATIDA